MDGADSPSDIIFSQVNDVYFADPCRLADAPPADTTLPLAPAEEGGATVDPAAALAGMALVLGGYWGRRFQEDESGSRRAKRVDNV